MLLTEDLGKEPNEYQGNWIPHKIRRATEGGVFFAGDSAGHCLPLSAEGIRTALYFGIALGRELRGVVEGEQSREQAAATYAEFHDSHEWKFRWMLRVQKLVPRVPPRMLAPLIRLLGNRRFVKWSFSHYLAIAPPEFAQEGPQQGGGSLIMCAVAKQPANAAGKRRLRPGWPAPAQRPRRARAEPARGGAAARHLGQRPLPDRDRQVAALGEDALRDHLRTRPLDGPAVRRRRAA